MSSRTALASLELYCYAMAIDHYRGSTCVSTTLNLPTIDGNFSGNFFLPDQFAVMLGQLTLQQ